MERDQKIGYIVHCTKIIRTSEHKYKKVKVRGVVLENIGAELLVKVLNSNHERLIPVNSSIRILKTTCSKRAPGIYKKAMSESLAIFNLLYVKKVCLN